MEPTKKKKPSRFISVRLPAMLKRSERRESGSLSAHAQLCSRELPKVESYLLGAKAVDANRPFTGTLFCVCVCVLP